MKQPTKMPFLFFLATLSAQNAWSRLPVILVEYGDFSAFLCCYIFEFCNDSGIIAL